jgi:hypothetical protein
MTVSIRINFRSAGLCQLYGDEATDNSDEKTKGASWQIDVAGLWARVRMRRDAQAH